MAYFIFRKWCDTFAFAFFFYKSTFTHKRKKQQQSPSILQIVTPGKTKKLNLK